MEDLLENSDYEIITYLAKKTRLDQNKIIHAVSHRLSKSTISNIENRHGNTSLKAVAQYLTNLGLAKDEVSKKIQEIEAELQDLEFQLELVHVFFDEQKLSEGRKLLEQIQVVDYHPLAAKIKYMKGRLLYLQNDFSKAKQLFNETIELYHKNNYNQPDLLPTCYNTLSSCYYHEEDPMQALKYINKGIFYLEKQTHPDIKHLLLVNKVLFLIVLNQGELAFELINQIWDRIHTVEPLKVRLNFYKFRSKLLKKAGQYDQAIACAKQGLYLARQNNDQNRTLSLLVVLGTAYLELGQFTKAASCFQTVMAFEKQRYPRRLADAHVYLGILHAKQGKWSQAEWHLTTAKNICKTYQVDIRRWVKLLIVYGNVLRQQDKFNEAIGLYEEALYLIKGKHQTSLRYDVLYQLLSCYKAAGDEDAFQRTNQEFFDLLCQLHPMDEVDLYESASPSFSPR